MQNYFAEKIEPGAPTRPDTHRRVKTSSRSENRRAKIHYFGIPKDKTCERYSTIINLDTVAKKQIQPVIAPLMLSFTATGKKRDTLLENLENWDILKNSKIICGADDATFAIGCDDVVTYAAAVKIGNEFISKTDAIYKFKGSPIIMAKTILTKNTRVVIESQLVEPTEKSEYKIKVLKPLNLGPFLDEVSSFNTQLSDIGGCNIYRKLNKTELLKEPRPPTNDHPSFNIHENYHGEETETLTRWLSTLIKYDFFLAHFESLKNELERRKKNDKEKLPPLGVTFALGKSNLEKLNSSALEPQKPTTDTEKEETQDCSLNSNSGISHCESSVVEPPKKAPKKSKVFITHSQLQRAVAVAKRTPKSAKKVEKKTLVTPPPEKQDAASTPARKPVPPAGRLLSPNHSCISEEGRPRTSRTGKKREAESSNDQLQKVGKFEIDGDGLDDDIDFNLEEQEREKTPPPTELKEILNDSTPSEDNSQYEDARNQICDDPGQDLTPQDVEQGLKNPEKPDNPEAEKEKIDEATEKAENGNSEEKMETDATEETDAKGTQKEPESHDSEVKLSNSEDLESF